MKLFLETSFLVLIVLSSGLHAAQKTSFPSPKKQRDGTCGGQLGQCAEKTKVQTRDTFMSGDVVIEMAKQFIEDGVDLNLPIDKSGRTVLMIAASIADVPSSTYLLNHGANINAEDHFGKNALWYALGSENLRYCRFLVKNGADTSKLKKVSRRWLNGK